MHLFNIFVAYQRIDIKADIHSDAGRAFHHGRVPLAILDHQFFDVQAAHQTAVGGRLSNHIGGG